MLGNGLMATNHVGARAATVTEMRDATGIIQTLLKGEGVEIGGNPERLEHFPSQPPPVGLAASSPRMLELAGEIAEGAYWLAAPRDDAEIALVASGAVLRSHVHWQRSLDSSCWTSLSQV